MTASSYAYLQRVENWLTVLYGKNSNDAKRKWLKDVAIALVNNEALPEIPLEGKTSRPWRAAKNRIETLKRFYVETVEETRS